MKIGVIGLGYVGLPLAVAFAEEGHSVVGVEIDPRKLDELAAGESYHDDYVPELPELGLESEALDAALEDADVAVIVTAHPELDARTVVERAPLTVDFRGVTRGIEAPSLVRL